MCIINSWREFLLLYVTIQLGTCVGTCTLCFVPCRNYIIVSVVQAIEHVISELGRYGRKRSWPAVSYRLEVQTKTTENPVRKTGLGAKISTRDLPNKEEGCCSRNCEVLFCTCPRQHSPSFCVLGITYKNRCYFYHSFWHQENVVNVSVKELTARNGARVSGTMGVVH
jgi:hypothetical protein